MRKPNKILIFSITATYMFIFLEYHLSNSFHFSPFMTLIYWHSIHVLSATWVFQYYKKYKW